MLLSDDLNGF